MSTEQDAQRFLTVTECCDFLSLSRSSFYRFMKLGRLPRPVKMNSKVARWRRDELLKAMAKLAPKEKP